METAAFRTFLWYRKAGAVVFNVGCAENVSAFVAPESCCASKHSYLFKFLKSAERIKLQAKLALFREMA